MKPKVANRFAECHYCLRDGTSNFHGRVYRFRRDLLLHVDCVGRWLIAHPEITLRRVAKAAKIRY